MKIETKRLRAHGSATPLCLFDVFYSLWKHVLLANLCASFSCREMGETVAMLLCQQKCFWFFLARFTTVLHQSSLSYLSHCITPEWPRSEFSPRPRNNAHARFSHKGCSSAVCTSRVTLTNISLCHTSGFSPRSASLALVFHKFWVSFSRCQQRVIGFRSAPPCQQT